jgi:hypothetical protein
MSTPRFALPKLLLTSVRRDYAAGQSESQGGIFTVDFAGQEVRQLVDWSSPEVDFRGRGIAFHGQEIYLAAPRELFVYGRDFRIRRSYESSYLADCQGVFRLENHLYLLSGGNDCILAFDLEQQGFFWAMHLAADGDGLQGRVFDPLGIDGPGGASGPPSENRLELNSLWADARGLFVSGARSGGMWHIAADRRVRLAVEMPEGIHDARPYRDGVLFNDSEAGVVRFSGRDGEEKAFAVPPEGESKPLARGLCVVDEYRFAAGSSPSMVSLYDLESVSRVASVSFSSDPRYVINALEVWPFD